jgi:hypothetical protein
MIYLTGMAAITPEAGVADTVQPNCQQASTRAATIPPISPADYGWKRLNRHSRASQLSCIAIGEALRSANILFPLTDEAERTGLVIGTNFSNLEAIQAMDDEARHYGANNVNPGLFPNTVLNVIGGYASIYLNIRGTNTTISNGLMSGTKALLYACDLLTLEQLERVVVCVTQLHPPALFQAVCDYSVTSESVVAVVLERNNHSSGQIRLEMKTDAESGEAEKSIEPADVLIELIRSANALHKQQANKEEWLINAGNEGRFTVTLQTEQGYNAYG